MREALDQSGMSDLAIWSLSDPSDADSQQAVSYAELIPVLIDAVNELAERVEELEAIQR